MTFRVAGSRGRRGFVVFETSHLLRFTWSDEKKKKKKLKYRDCAKKRRSVSTHQPHSETAIEALWQLQKGL